MTTTAPSLRTRLQTLFPTGEIVRYLIVGVFNTLFGFCTYAAALYLLNRVAPSHLLGMRVTQPKLAIVSSVISTPVNITVAYLNYKFFVFRTHGNFLREWLKAFSVYGVSTFIGLAALSAITKLFEALLHGYAPLGKATPGYLAGACMTLVITLISFVGHKKVTFGNSPSKTPNPIEPPIV